LRGVSIVKRVQSGSATHVKKPSRRPCCLVPIDLVRRSAPLRTRSSLEGETGEQRAGSPGGRQAHLKPRSVHINLTRPSTSGFFHSSCSHKMSRHSRVHRCTALTSTSEPLCTSG
jgi:hypothetical protein